MDSFATPYPVLFRDGEKDHLKGHIGIHPLLSFAKFQSQMSRLIGITASDLCIYLVSQRSPNDVTEDNPRPQRFYINENTNFGLIVSHHHPSLDGGSHFHASRKRTKRERRSARLSSSARSASLTDEPDQPNAELRETRLRASSTSTTSRTTMIWKRTAAEAVAGSSVARKLVYTPSSDPWPSLPSQPRGDKGSSSPAQAPPPPSQARSSSSDPPPQADDPGDHGSSSVASISPSSVLRDDLNLLKLDLEDARAPGAPHQRLVESLTTPPPARFPCKTCDESPAMAAVEFHHCVNDRVAKASGPSPLGREIVEKPLPKS
ncbi:hypothetical protein SELMODRAFT_419461 [Selaginella moellendorffii]|uniref:DUF7138 domain-containing protein n=1 Tax=Selaginella moellendorffii TaxID=88036 RepID=D8S912_SELML|nr:hypothetical protein SELMODRAFT_419461 [Selaginella moellendorffii]